MSSITIAAIHVNFGKHFLTLLLMFLQMMHQAEISTMSLKNTRIHANLTFSNDSETKNT